MPGKPKGLPKTGGRKKGTPNKSTVVARECLELAFDGIGGVPALIEWAQDPDNRVEFYRIWSKIIPQQVNHADSKGDNLPAQEKHFHFDLSKLSDDTLEIYRKVAERRAAPPPVVVDAPANSNGNGNGHHA